jgi:GDPmannose 4,6-dehydratase
MKKKIALITGVTGQDGSYLAEFLLSKGYAVHGIKRRSSSFNTSRIDHIYEEPYKRNKNFYLHHGDLTDSANLISIISKVNPSEIYNLAAQSHVGVSFEMPEYTSDVVALGTLRILEAIRTLNLQKRVKYYQASSSEMFGKVQEFPQTEKTPFYPRSPYAVSKVFAHWITINYRESYDLFACNGILFNHESPRRGETFVTRKITMGLSSIVLGLSNNLVLGNLDSKRDWGHARDYVEMMWLMLQQKDPEDFVISTNLQLSVRDFLIETSKVLGFEIGFSGKGLKEIGYVKKIKNSRITNLKLNQVIVRVSKRYFRPSEVDNLKGNAAYARKQLGWKPKITIKKMISEMVKEDYKKLMRDKIGQ